MATAESPWQRPSLDEDRGAEPERLSKRAYVVEAADQRTVRLNLSGHLLSLIPSRR